VIEYFINQLHEDGITEIPPWTEPLKLEGTGNRAPLPSTSSPATEEGTECLQLPKRTCHGAEGGTGAETEEEEYSMSSSSLMLGASATNIARGSTSASDASDDAEGNKPPRYRLPNPPHKQSFRKYM
jgi:hypothetical protein